MTAGIVQIMIDVRVDGDEISGYASDGVTERKPFLGWLGLIGVLDGLLAAPSSPDAPPPVSSTPPPCPIRTIGDDCQPPSDRHQDRNSMEAESNITDGRAHARSAAGPGARHVIGFRNALLCTVVVGAALALGVAGARASSVRPVGVDLGHELNGLVRLPDGPPGAIVVVQRGGQRRIYRAGVRQLGSTQPVSASDRMRLASTAKAFSAAVALSLVSAHRLSLRDTIAKLLPWLPAAWGQVTLGEALNHTSGLPDFSGTPAFLKYLKAHLHATPSPRFLLGFAAHEPLEFRPGSRYEYSNTDNFIVAMMARAVAHRTYRSLLATQVYRPLGLRHTTLPSTAALPEPFLHGYQPDPPGPPEDVSTLISAAYAWASGGLVSTPADLSQFIRGYAGARLFSRAVQRQQLRFVPGNSEPIGPGVNGAGLGIFRYRTRCGTVYGHTGNTSGYTQFMAATLDGRRSVTASVSEQITNRSTGARLAAFRRLRQIETDAVCTALSR
jgi:D-alanyl-D-alanine carboxypeptidase